MYSWDIMVYVLRRLVRKLIEIVEPIVNREESFTAALDKQ